MGGQVSLVHRRSRHRLPRSLFQGVAVCAAVSALCVGGGGAYATPTPLASTYDHTTTDDGWNLELRANELVVNPMSNIANAPTSREGWISARVGAKISGNGDQPVTSGVLEQFLVVGCQVDVSDGATLGLGFSAGPNVGVTISGVPGANIGASASVSPSISAKIAPGKITEISLGKKTLATDHASIRIKRAHVSVDGCLGPTTVRVIARFSVSTPTADDTLNVYSARTWL
ncbi:MspA family porin [Gordonia oryzae]|uniref:MspA family porin n=1 Tax=Gordonia oryzae TaxID=2487349 RepID=UPI003F828C0A